MDDDNNIVAQGMWGKIRYAVQRNGIMPAKKAYDKLKGPSIKDKLLKKDNSPKSTFLALFKRMAEKGKIFNNQQFRHLKGAKGKKPCKIYEFKHDVMRFYCFEKGNCWFLTHYYGQKHGGNKAIQKQIEIATKIMNEHNERSNKSKGIK